MSVRAQLLRLITVILLMMPLTHGMAQSAKPKPPRSAGSQQTGKGLGAGSGADKISMSDVYSNAYALLIGINHYPGVPGADLTCAVNDVTALKQVLVQSYGFKPGNIHTLTDSQATKDGIEAELGQLTDKRRIHGDDCILIFFSGHGQTVPLPGGGSMGFLIPNDARLDLHDITNAAPYIATCVKMRDIWDDLDASPAKHVLLVADACYSGLLCNSRAIRSDDREALKYLKSQRAREVMTAGGQNQESVEDPNWGHGAFTYKLLEELKTRSVDVGQMFTANELYSTLQTEVLNLTQGKQNPQLGKHEEEGDFLFIPTGKAAVGVDQTQDSTGSTGKNLGLTASLKVDSDPPGATVLVDGKPVGQTPFVGNVSLLQDGQTVQVEVDLDGYDAVTLPVALTKDGVAVPSVTLKKSVVTTDHSQDDNTGTGGTLDLPHGARMGQVYTNPADGAQMVYVPAGEFEMGDNELIGADNAPNNPRHVVRLSGYWVYKYPVTVAQYQKFCMATGRAMPHGPNWDLQWQQRDHPIVGVTWDDAHAYSVWAGVTLPTEAQWEKAARGTKARKYPWGDAWDAAIVACSHNVQGDAHSTFPVGAHPQNASPYGALDMAGNVWEWCSDYYDPNYWLRNQGADPTGPADGGERVVRGGSYLDTNPLDFRSAARSSQDPGMRAKNVGFRCVGIQR